MTEIVAFKCDGCGKVILEPRDVYRLNMEGAEWREGPPVDTCQHVKKLGFCEMCARDIKRCLERIAGKA